MRVLKHPVIIVFLFLAGCGNRHNEDIIQQNFDDLALWHPPVTGITDIGAHSGKLSCLLDGQHPYSIAYITDYSKILLKGYKEITASAYFKQVDPQAHVSLSISIESGDKKLAYESSEPAGGFGMENWTQVTVHLKFPRDNQPESRLKVYAYTPDGKSLLMDDLEIQYK